MHSIPQIKKKTFKNIIDVIINPMFPIINARCLTGVNSCDFLTYLIDEYTQRKKMLSLDMLKRYYSQCIDKHITLFT